jgi:DNA-binding response OmpR family regulator
MIKNSNPCILLVDDDLDWLELMQHTLKKEGFNPIVSVNGVDMWEKIQACHPKLILMDIHMEGISGETYCQLLKSNPATSQIPVLMYSSNRDIEDVAKRCGADGYVEKSLSSKEVKERVMQYV